MPTHDSIHSTESHELAGATVILALTGSVAVLRAIDLARLLMRHGARVLPVMSPAAATFVGPRLVHWATGVEPILGLTGANEHVEYAGNGRSRADVLLIAPATANTIGKIASAIDDTVVTTFATTAIGQGIPVLIAPAMHEPMAHHPGVARNLETLGNLGVTVIPSRLAEGKAKMASPERILDDVIRAVSRARGSALAGRKVLVTAGRTVEYIDPIRVLTNNSSGKMGVALARAAFRAGAEVTLVYGKGTAEPPDCVDLVRVETAREMFDAVMSRAGDGNAGYDALIASAAVGDWEASDRAPKKITTHGADRLTITLVPTPKIIDAVKSAHPRLRLVAFRAQHDLSRDEFRDDARARMEKAGADLIAANDVARTGVGFETDTNAMTLFHRDGRVVEIPLASKQTVASRIIAELGAVLSEGHGSTR